MPEAESNLSRSREVSPEIFDWLIRVDFLAHSRYLSLFDSDTGTPIPILILFPSYHPDFPSYHPEGDRSCAAVRIVYLVIGVRHVGCQVRKPENSYHYPRSRYFSMTSGRTAAE